MGNRRKPPSGYERCREQNALAAVARQLQASQAHDNGTDCKPKVQECSEVKEISTTAVHLASSPLVGEEATSPEVLAPTTKKKRTRRTSLHEEQPVEEQCSSGDPQPPQRVAKRKTWDQQGDLMGAVRRVSKHVYNVMLPQLEACSAVTDEQVAAQAHACMDTLLRSDGGEDEDAALPPHYDESMQLWAHVERICRDAVVRAHGALGASVTDHQVDQESNGDNAFGNAYRDTFVNEFADDLEAVRQHAVASESGVVPLDELVRLISSGTNVFSPSQRHALYSTC